MPSLLRLKSLRPALTGAALGIGVAVAPIQAAAAGTFITSSGAKVPMPNIASLNCDEMADVLAAIDASGYRGQARRPRNEADAPLLDYEDRLARTHFQRCARPGRGSAPESAFTGGYDR